MFTCLHSPSFSATPRSVPDLGDDPTRLVPTRPGGPGRFQDWMYCWSGSVPGLDVLRRGPEHAHTQKLGVGDKPGHKEVHPLDERQLPRRREGPFSPCPCL